MSFSSAQSCGPPPPEATYSEINTGITAIQRHARDHGYALVRRDKQQNRIVYTCDRYRKYSDRGKKEHVNEMNRRRNTGSRKTDCKMKLAVVRNRSDRSWKVSIIQGEHNHARSADAAAHPTHRLAAIPAETAAQIDTFAKAGLSNAQIVSTLRQESNDVTLTSKDVSNLVQKSRSKELNGMSPLLWLLKVRNFIARADYLLTNYLGITRQRLLPYVRAKKRSPSPALFHCPRLNSALEAALRCSFA